MKFENAFVVYDPTQSAQPALERAAMIAAEAAVKLHVFACIFLKCESDEDEAASRQGFIEEQEKILSSAVAPLIAKGIEVTTEVEWDKNWYEAVVRASIRHGADIVLKSSYPHTARQRILNKTSDRTLIRGCLCPVLLVKGGAERSGRTILAAVDIRADKSSYDKLNEQIIRFGQRLMTERNAEVHFINAFGKLNAVPDRNALIRKCGVPGDRIHIHMGEPDDVLVERARDLGASLLVVGNSGRTGITGAFKGNTIEKVLDRLDCDVLSVPAAPIEELSPAAA